jgi:hypothetical protein
MIFSSKECLFKEFLLILYTHTFTNISTVENLIDKRCIIIYLIMDKSLRSSCNRYYCYRNTNIFHLLVYENWY